MWIEVVFFAGIVPIIIILGISYWKSKRFYPLLYILSIFAMINTVAYVIDFYPLGRNGILFTLILAALILMGFGFYLNKELSDKKTSSKKHTWNKIIIIMPLLITLLFFVVGIFDIGITSSLTYGTDIPRTVLFPTQQQSNNCSFDYINNVDNAHELATLELSSYFFLSRSVEVPQFVACFDKQTIGQPQLQYSITYVDAGKQIPADILLGKGFRGYYDLPDTLTATSGQTKQLHLYIIPHCQRNYAYERPPVKPVPEEQAKELKSSDIKNVYLFKQHSRKYKDCYQLFEDENPVHIFEVVG